MIMWTYSLTNVRVECIFIRDFNASAKLKVCFISIKFMFLKFYTLKGLITSIKLY